MPDLDAEMLVDQAVMLGLVSREQLREATAEAEDTSADTVLRMLLRKGLLTSWQIERLKKGDPTGFFYGDAKALFHLAEGTFARVYRGEHITTKAPWRLRCSGSGSCPSVRLSSGFTKRPRPASGCAIPISSRSSTSVNKTNDIS